MSRKSIAFLGLGAMGSRMALNLVAAGHDVTVWNRDAARAEALAGSDARIAGSPRAAAAGADMVFAMVRDDAASAFVWQDPEVGALAAMRSGAVAVDCSTLTLGHVRGLADAARAAGVDFLDAPVAGSRPQAVARQLIFMVGGEAETLKRAEPVLLAMGAAVHHAGPNGAGAAVKLAVNALFGVQVAAMAELIGLLKRSGVDVAKAVEIIGTTPVASLAAKGAAASMLAGSFAPMFPVELVAKDFGYVRAAGQDGGAATPLADAAAAVLAEATAQGFASDNLTGIVRLYA